ncbi:uncharacterized protein LOC129740653 [Uranotaenia lowii]|uniref:uncharacterized protein LOC129740653 n=1 Tax=Uranotaenia lowii TaxID=190385 RepID=UPI002479AAC5|nr:uncharacterized protein LOC129740653 [Uranotaenia lowii]
MAVTFDAPNMLILVMQILALQSVTSFAYPDPEPEPDPARVLGKYVFSYQPSGQDSEQQFSRKPLDLTRILESLNLEPQESISHNIYEQPGSGSTSPGYMTSYSTATRHFQPIKTFDITGNGEDSEEKNNYVSSTVFYDKHKKKKQSLPLLQSYSIIHSPKDSGSVTRPLGDSDEEQEEQADVFRPIIKTIHTKAKSIPIAQHIEVEKPVPVPMVKKIHVPIPKGVKVHIPHPVLVPVPQPYPVHVPVSQPVAVPVIKEITIPIEKIVPYPVEKKVPVPIEKPVPYPVEKHVPVHIPQPYPVKVPVIKTIYHKQKAPRTVGVGSVTFR